MEGQVELAGGLMASFWPPWGHFGIAGRLAEPADSHNSWEVIMDLVGGIVMFIGFLIYAGALLLAFAFNDSEEEEEDVRTGC